MTAAIAKFFAPWTVRATVKDKTGGEPKPRRSPVFINDAVTPWRQETLLLSILRAQSEEDQP